MITLKTSRHFAATARDHFFPFINLLKQTRINNLAHKSLASEEYLNAMVINCLISEIESIIIKKLVNTKGATVKIDFSDAQGVVLYKTLLAVRLPEDHFYYNTVRNNWIELLDKEIIRNNLYQMNQPRKTIFSATTAADYYEM